MGTTETYLFYGGAALLSVLFSWISEKTGKRFGLVLSVLVLSLVAGLRAHTVGIDTMLYKNGVEYFFETNEVYWKYSFAYGYGVFSKIMLTVFNDYSFLLFIESLITNGLIIARFWDYRKNASVTFMVFAYICTSYFFTMCIICQFLAIAIVFYFSRFLEKNRPVVYSLGVVLASTIHISALVAFLPVGLYLMNRKHANALGVFIKIIGFGVLVAIAVFTVGQFFTSYSGYNSSARASSVGLMVFFQIGVFVMALVLSGYFSRKNDTDDNGIKAILKKESPYTIPLYTVAMLLAALSYVITNAGRISYYFAVFGPVFYGFVAARSGKNKATFLCAMLLVIWFVSFAVYTFFLHDGLGIIPYSFFWD